MVYTSRFLIKILYPYITTNRIETASEKRKYKDIFPEISVIIIINQGSSFIPFEYQTLNKETKRHDEGHNYYILSNLMGFV